MRLATLAALLLVVACENTDSRVARGQSSADTSAASVWIARAEAQPDIASWLYLRAASVTPDSAARRALYGRVTLPLAKARVPWVEAAAREQFGDTLGALRAYSALPAPVTVFRLRAALDSSARDSVRPQLLAFISHPPSSAAAREATALFDKLFPRATAAEQLTVARASAAAGSWSRARSGFDGSSSASLTSADRFAFGTSLARTNADARAAQVFASVTTPASLARAAQYERALSLLSAGDRTSALTVLHALGAQRSDTSAAAALALIADLQTDDGNDSGSRITLLSLVQRFPSTRFAAPARFNAALVALILGNASTADSELAALVASSPSSALRAGYWLGRARAARGDSSGAAAAWRAVVKDDSTSYYAGLAAARLHVESMHSTNAPTRFPRLPSVDSAMRRVSLLQQFGMSPEAALENDRLYSDARADTSRLLATAAAFSGTDQAARAIALGRIAIARFGSTPGIWRLVYPVAARDTIVTESQRAGIDPALVAALIRQESNFNPAARSAAGARGLMQVMPSVGKSIAPTVGITSWDPALLYDPGVNVEIGVRHLAPLLRNEASLPKSLAAYNAGESRVKRWATKRGADDPEIFTERIPFAETQDYVKNVLRNRDFYRVLYSW